MALLTGQTPCDEAPFRNDIEIEYWVRDDTSATQCEGYSCAFPFGHQYLDSVSGHLEWSGYAVRFKTSHINGGVSLYHHVINHETGHVLGLQDGDGTCPDPDSVMHSIYYGCEVNAEWPSAEDRASVGALIWEPVASGPQCGRSPTWSNC